MNEIKRAIGLKIALLQTEISTFKNSFDRNKGSMSTKDIKEYELFLKEKKDLLLKLKIENLEHTEAFSSKLQKLIFKLIENQELSAEDNRICDEIKRMNNE